MPLSEHEQRQLEAIERSLYADDPKFARQVRTAGSGGRSTAVLVQGGLLLVVGLVLLVLTVVSVVLGIVGFFVMLAGLVRISGAFTTRTETPRPAGGSTGRSGRLGRGPRPGAGRHPSGGSTKASWTEKAEERWRQRLEGGDDRDR